MKKPSKPSHQLNLQAVEVWANSLSPEERAQWINSLLERNGIPAEPSAEQEAKPRELEHEVQPHELELAEERELKLELDTLAQKLNQEAQNLEQEVRAQKLKQDQAQKLKQVQAQKLDQAQKLKLEPQKLKQEQALAQVLKLEQEQGERELERLAQALADGLERKGG
jgi:hypothetical protein